MSSLSRCLAIALALLTALPAWSRAVNAAAPFGAYTYQTLDDLAANRPASYNRTLSFTERSTATAMSALWLRGESRLVPNRLRFEYGIRTRSRSWAAARPDGARRNMRPRFGCL